MRVSFASDVHGNVEGLARAADAAEFLVVLGDLLDYVDYHEPENGILGTVFGADEVRRFAALRSAHEFVELRRLNESLWSRLDDPVGTLTDVVAARYAEFVDVLAGRALLLLGNVDVLSVWQEVAGDRLRSLDSEVVEVAGRRFGFVGGGSGRRGYVPRGRSTVVWQPFVRPAEEFEAAVRSLGPVDVLCSHVPPDIAVMRYDRLPARLEMFGPGLVEAIDEHQPALAVSGHVHQPLSQRTRRGRTECVNVGHFQRYPTTFDVEFD